MLFKIVFTVKSYGQQSTGHHQIVMKCGMA